MTHATTGEVHPDLPKCNMYDVPHGEAEHVAKARTEDILGFALSAERPEPTVVHDYAMGVRAEDRASAADNPHPTPEGGSPLRSSHAAAPDELDMPRSPTA